MRGYFAFASALLTGAILCSTPAFADDSYDPSFDCYEGPYRLHLPKTYTELKKIGSLQSEKVLETVKDSAETATRIALDFGSLYISVLTSSDKPEKFLTSLVESSDPKWQITGPFRVGESFKSALRKLHQKSSPDPKKWEYGGDGASVSFEVSAGKITKVTYQCYSG